MITDTAIARHLAEKCISITPAAIGQYLNGKTKTCRYADEIAKAVEILTAERRQKIRKTHMAIGKALGL